MDEQVEYIGCETCADCDGVHTCGNHYHSVYNYQECIESEICIGGDV